MNQFNLTYEQMENELVALGYVKTNISNNTGVFTHILLGTTVIVYPHGVTDIASITTRGRRQVLGNNLALSAIKTYINNK